MSRVSRVVVKRGCLVWYIKKVTSKDVLIHPNFSKVITEQVRWILDLEYDSLYNICDRVWLLPSSKEFLKDEGFLDLL